MKSKFSGFVAITSVLIMSAGIWIILIGMVGLHLNESLTMQSWRKANTLSLLGDGCFEVTARSIILNKFYTGQTLSQGLDSCIINVIKTGNKFQINITARSGDYYKKFKIGAVLTAGKLNINSWQELE